MKTFNFDCELEFNPGKNIIQSVKLFKINKDKNEKLLIENFNHQLNLAIQCITYLSEKQKTLNNYIREEELKNLFNIKYNKLQKENEILKEETKK